MRAAARRLMSVNKAKVSPDRIAHARPMVASSWRSNEGVTRTSPSVTSSRISHSPMLIFSLKNTHSHKVMKAGKLAKPNVATATQLGSDERREGQEGGRQ